MHNFIVGEKVLFQKVIGFTIIFFGALILFDFYIISENFLEINGLEFKAACFGAAMCYSICIILTGSIITCHAPAILELSLSASRLKAGSIPITTNFINGGWASQFF